LERFNRGNAVSSVPSLRGLLDRVLFAVAEPCAGDLREPGGRQAGDRVTGRIGIAWGGHRHRGRVLRSAVGPGFPALAEHAGSQSVQPRELIVRHLGGLASFGLITVVVDAPTKAASDPAFERVVAHVQRTLRSEAAVTTVVRPCRGVERG
jgi:hypothetical protein